MMAIVVALGLVVLLLGILVVGLLRSHAEILRRLHDLDDGGEEPSYGRSQLLQIAPRADGVTGGAAPNLRGLSLADESVEIGLVGAPDNTLLAFLSSTCYTCEPFWAELAAGAVPPGGARTIAVVQTGDALTRLRKLAGATLLVIRSDDAWSDYQVPGSPHFVYVDAATGRIAGEGTASTWRQICELFTQATQASPDPRLQSTAGGSDGRDNAARIDAELLAAGIGAGHPSLYPDAVGSTEPAVST
jgi:hypothetical protein